MTSIFPLSSEDDCYHQMCGPLPHSAADSQVWRDGCHIVARRFCLRSFRFISCCGSVTLAKVCLYCDSQTDWWNNIAVVASSQFSLVSFLLLDDLSRTPLSVGGLVVPTFLLSSNLCSYLSGSASDYTKNKGRKKISQKWEPEGEEILPMHLQNRRFLVIKGQGKGLPVQALTKEDKLPRMPGEWYKRFPSSAPLSADPSLCLPVALIPRLRAARRLHNLVRYETGNKKELNFLLAKNWILHGPPC